MKNQLCFEEDNALSVQAHEFSYLVRIPMSSNT
jgi:hypothetical protein